MNDDLEIPYERFASILMLLAGLFIFRVLAQLIQFLSPIPYLPAFSAWQSGAISYRWLLVSQVSIVVVLLFSIHGMRRKTVNPRRTLGRILMVLGSIYFASMAARLCAGLTFAEGHFWLGALLPTFFHLVLASIVLTLGFFHLRHGVR